MLSRHRNFPGAQAVSSSAAGGVTRRLLDYSGAIGI